MAGDQKKPVIVIKKIKKAHGGHHGGSWKVAYADFVTAMMAFFMVLWILGMDDEVKGQIQAYFANPVGLQEGYSTGSSPVASRNSAGISMPSHLQFITRQHEQQHFQELSEKIEETIAKQKGLGSLAAQVEVVITDQGLRIELVEGGNGEMFFGFGSARIKPAAADLLKLIAGDLATSSAPIVVEGHTDSAPFGRPGYTNWELSADRANAARRVLEAAGIQKPRIREIRGYADLEPRNPADLMDPENRRISIMLPFVSRAPRIEEIAPKN